MTRLWVVIAGVFGLVVPIWTLNWYAPQDNFARVLIGLIVIGLVAGVFELFRRGQRVDELREALPGLEGAAEGLEGRLQAVPQELERLVRSRIHGEARSLPALALTPYLVSLLVLLGLLGTFVGLVDTLSAAREALSASSDVPAMRSALLVPMQGLSRAFGTSVAGVASSAMLGLALTLTRRFEARIYAVLDDRFAAELADATLVGRQIRALERLADQSDDLPQAVRDLSEVAVRIPEIEAAMSSRHDETMKSLRDSVERSAQDIGRTLRAGIDNAVQAQEEVLGQIVDETAELLAEKTESFTKKLEQEAGARRQAEETQHKRWEKLVETNTTLVENRMAELFAKEEERLRGWQEKETERASVLDAHLKDLATQQAERNASLGTAWEGRLNALIDQDSARAQAWENAISEASSLSQKAAASTEAASDRLSSLEESMRNERSEALRSLHAEVERWLAATSANVQEERSGLVEMANQVSSRIAELEAAATQRAETLHQNIESVVEAQRESHEALVEKTHTLLDQTEGKAGARLSEVAEQVTALAESQLNQERAFEEELRQGREESARALADTLTSYADEMRSALSEAIVAVREGADAIAAGGIEMSTLAERFSGAVDSYKEANQDWLERLAAIEARKSEGADEAGDEQLGAYLEQTREVFDRSVELQMELYQGVRALRGESGAGEGESSSDQDEAESDAAVNVDDKEVRTADSDDEKSDVAVDSTAAEAETGEPAVAGEVPDGAILESADESTDEVDAAAP